MNYRLKKIISSFLVVSLICAPLFLNHPAKVALAQGDVIIIEHDTDDADVLEYTDKGFSKSGVEGYPGLAKGSRAAGESGYAIWAPSNLLPGTYRVHIWKVVRAESVGGRDTSVKIETVHDGKTEVFMLSQTGEAGWVELGTFYFSGKGNEYVKMIRTTAKGEKDENGKVIFTQADSVKFQLMEKDESAAAKIEKADEPKASTDEASLLDYKNGIFRVDSFGAKPDDEKDDSPAIRIAIEAAISYGKGGVVVFSEGRYVIDKPANKIWVPFTFCFDYSDTDGLTILGDGTELLVKDNFVGVFRFTNARNLTVKGLTIDYEQLPLFQGEVTAVNPDTGAFDVKPMDGNTLFDDARLESCLNVAFGTVRDRENNNLMKKTAHDFFRLSAYEKVQDGYRLTIQEKFKHYVGDPKEIDVGDRITFSNRGNNGSIFDIRQDGRGGFNENITIEDITIYASPHAAIVNTYNEGFLYVNNINVIRNPNRLQWMVTNTDALFPQHVRKGVTVLNSSFEGICDDVISVHQKTSVLSKIHSENKIEVTHASRTPIKGDIIEVFDRMSGTIKGSATILDVEEVMGQPIYTKAILLLDKSISGLKESVGTEEGDHILNRSINESNVIRGNKISDSRRYGVFVTGVNNIIENNTFKNLGAGMINMYAGTANLVTTNLQILNNTGENLSFLEGNPPAIRILFEKRGQTYVAGESIFYENILIKNNVIKGHHGRSLLLGNIENVQIIGNTFESSDEFNENKRKIPSLEIVNTKNITIDQLSIIDSRETLTAGIRISDDCGSVTFGEISIDIPQDALKLDVPKEKIKYEQKSPINFEDIKNHWAKDDIEIMVFRGIVKGVSEVSFAPDLAITRAEFSALMERLLELETHSHKGVFSDVSGKEWYSDTIQTVYQAGLIDEGMIENNLIMPQLPITREEMVSMIVRGYEIATGKTLEQGSIDSYVDKDNISLWAREYVKKAEKLGIVKGVSETQFAPKDNATRAQAVVIMKRLTETLKGSFL